MYRSTRHQRFIDLLSVNPAAKEGARASACLLTGLKQNVSCNTVCTLARRAVCLSDGASALSCRCGGPPFDEQVTQNEFRLSLIHPAQYIPDDYLTRITYWPITWPVLLGKLSIWPSSCFFSLCCLFCSSCLSVSEQSFFFLTTDGAWVMACQTDAPLTKWVNPWR